MQLGHIVDIHKGCTHVGLEQSDEGHVLVFPKHIGVDGNLIFEDLIYVTIEPTAEPFALETHDILYACYFDTNVAVLFPELPDKYIFANPILRLRVNDQSTVKPEYLAWHMNTPSFRKTTDEIRMNKIMRWIDPSLLKQLDIPIPPVRDQLSLVGKHVSERG